MSSRRAELTAAPQPAVVFDGRYINDRYHGIGRYAFHLLGELATQLPAQRFTVLRDTSLADTRFDWRGLLELGNIDVQEVAAAPFSLKEQASLARLPDLRRCNLYHTPYFALPWLLSAPAVVTVHDCIFELDARYMPRRWARFYYGLLMARSLSRSRAVFVPSEATAHDVRRFYKVPTHKLIVTPEAADATFRPIADSALLAEVRARYDLPGSFVLAVGARRPHKNFGMLVRAVSGIPDANLVFAGNADERFTDEAALEARALGRQVRFLGTVPEADLPALYNLAMAFACPSLVEGFGLPVLEAMACGTPVVCSDIEVFREVAGRAALIASPKSVGDWTAALDRVLTNGDLRAALSRLGTDRASLFTWRRTAEAVLPFYSSLNR